jgi:uncharacterized membrane protein
MPRRTEYERGREEFARVLAFSDGIFAIAMTLLVVALGVPSVTRARLGHALRDMVPEFVGFFVSFVVIGKYWLAHHRFFSLLQRMSVRLVWFNLLYLAVIAFLPFPSALIGEYEGSALAVMIFAISLGTASFLEVVLFVEARRSEALVEALPDDVYRFGLVAQLLPVAILALSIPVAFLVNSTVALVSWLSVYPLEAALGRWRPPTADEYL